MNQAQALNLKPGDKIRCNDLCDESFKNKIYTFKKINKYHHQLLQVEEDISPHDYINIALLELVENLCQCPITTIIVRGCICGGK